jgi:hypothetical protein
MLKELKVSRNVGKRAITEALRSSDGGLPKVLDHEFLQLSSKSKQNFSGCRNRHDLRKRKQFHNFTASRPSMWPELESTKSMESYE